MTKAEELILRSQHILMRASFSPNDPTAQAKHFMALQQDIGPWLQDYVTLMETPQTPSHPPAKLPNLGYATTSQLLEEIKARVEVHAKPHTRTDQAYDLIQNLQEFITHQVEGGLSYTTVAMD